MKVPAVLNVSVAEWAEDALRARKIELNRRRCLNVGFIGMGFIRVLTGGLRLEGAETEIQFPRSRTRRVVDNNQKDSYRWLWFFRWVLKWLKDARSAAERLMALDERGPR